MRIFIASGIFHPDSGGPATYLHQLLPELQARGHTVRALAYGNAPTMGYPYPLQRIPFGGLPFSRWGRYWWAYRQGAAWADVVYLNTLGVPRSSDGRAGRVMKVVGDYAWERCVTRGWLPPNADIDAFQTRRYGPHIEWYKASRARAVQAMQYIIVPSDYLRQMVIGWGMQPERVQVIYNALERPPEAQSLSRKAARAQLGWPAQAPIVLTAARLTAWKGIDYLIDALKHLPDVRLVVAGDGPEFAALQGRAAACGVADRVTFLGKTPHERMALLMRAADYLALYSGYEGLSHTLLEALSSGTPVIASARGGNPEVVTDGVNGLLVKHPDLDALITALRRAFAGETRAQLAAGTAHGLDRFGWTRLIDQTTAALERAARTLR